VTILGLEGALGVFSVAIVRDGEVLAATTIPGNLALESGLDAVDRMMREAGVVVESGAPGGRPRVDRIAVGVGPGRFTGLRIAISYAKALAQAWGMPLVPIPSSELVPQDVFGRLGERDFTVETLEPPIANPALTAALLARSREPAASPHEVRADYGNHAGPKIQKLPPLA
jgi:tRNA threonylcarbamoyl adenosine modification protein YeaZ